MAGTDFAIEPADVVLVNSNPVDILSTLKLSKASYRNMDQNIGWLVIISLQSLLLQVLSIALTSSKTINWCIWQAKNA
ncbi:hypothetical protein [Ureibacillus chungkukjangi]|uniref:hypothetical protein n=1 Tax=Ureibacillus chungkukjangi TaxID=1202712 RepID=UPI002006F77D|nr:hypothetical protein [Ureibacillus chungkukjangi]